MGVYASKISNRRTETLNKNRLEILAYQYPASIDSSKIDCIPSVENEIIMNVKYRSIEISKGVKQKITPTVILGNTSTSTF